MQFAPLVVIVSVFLTGCAGLENAERPCARLDLNDWDPNHAQGEPIEPFARLTNCGDAVLSVPGCHDSTMELRFTIEGMPDPKDVRIVLCPSDDHSGKAIQPARLSIPADGSAEGSASWSGNLQKCYPHMCDPARPPPSGTYTLVVAVEGVSATTRAPLVIR